MAHRSPPLAHVAASGPRLANFPTCGEGSRLGGTVGETTAKPGGLPQEPPGAVWWPGDRR